MVLRCLGRIKCEEDRGLWKIKPLCCIPIFNFLLEHNNHLSLLSYRLYLGFFSGVGGPLESGTMLPDVGRLKDGAKLSVPFCNDEIQTQATCVDFTTY